MDDCGGKMDHRCETCICFVAAQGDAFELFEFAEKILDEMPPFVNLPVDRERLASAWMLRDDDFRATLVQIGDDRIERLVRDQAAKCDAFDERRDANRVEALAGHQDKPRQVSQSVGQRKDFGGPAALGLA